MVPIMDIIDEVDIIVESVVTAFSVVVRLVPVVGCSRL
jgi:hypothetical protein